MEIRTLDLRGIPLWLLQEYLEKLGGQPAGDGWTRGPGWQASLTPIEDAYIGRLPVNQIRLEWQAEPEAHALYWPKLELKIMRGGG